MIGNKRIKLVMAGFLIAGATVTNITGVGSFADEIATFGTYNVYHSQRRRLTCLYKVYCLHKVLRSDTVACFSINQFVKSVIKRT